MRGSIAARVNGWMISSLFVIHSRPFVASARLVLLRRREQPRPLLAKLLGTFRIRHSCKADRLRARATLKHVVCCINVMQAVERYTRDKLTQWTWNCDPGRSSTACSVSTTPNAYSLE